MKLAISLATRNRAKQLLDTIAADLRSMARPDTVLMVQVDDDDTTTIAALQAKPLDPRVKVNIAPREDTIAGKWNRVLTEPADVYLVAADDDPIITSGADEKILEAAATYPDGIAMVYGHMVNVSFTSIVAMTSKLTMMLRYLQPEYFPYWFCDHWTDDIGRMIGRFAFADVRTDQRSAQKTQEMREPAWWATWFDAGYRLRCREAQAIIESADFAGEPWQKAALIRNMPLAFQRSCWINQHVRNISGQLETWSGLFGKDERYQRVKDKAIAMVPRMLEGMAPEEAQAYANALTPPDRVVALPRAYG